MPRFTFPPIPIVSKRSHSTWDSNGQKAAHRDYAPSCGDHSGRCWGNRVFNSNSLCIMRKIARRYSALQSACLHWPSKLRCPTVLREEQTKTSKWLGHRSLSLRPRVVTGVPRSFSILILPILTSVRILIIRETKYSFVLLAILRKHKLGW